MQKKRKPSPYAETLWPQQAVISFGIKPLYWRFGARKETYVTWIGSEGNGMFLGGWHFVIAQFGPFSISIGALPIVGNIEDVQTMKKDETA